MSRFIKQCKGTDSDKLQMPILWDNWLYSIKYDGHYMQVHTSAREIVFYTSSGKKYLETNLAKVFNKLPTGVYECEFLGYSDGKHGDRKEAAFATTLRTEYAKHITSNYPGLKCVIFDIINNDNFLERLKILHEVESILANEKFVSVAKYYQVSEPVTHLTNVLKDGWEGIYLKNISHLQYEGKRVKNAIKLKAHHTADVRCIDIEAGEGKYDGKIGSLVCVDENGIEVKVGSGLTDHDRNQSVHAFLGKTIEIAYESFSDTYIHPVYKGIRSDK